MHRRHAADLVSPKQMSALTPAIKELARSNDLLGFWTCSAKEEANLSRSITTLISKLLEQRHSDEIKYLSCCGVVRTS